MEYLFLNVGDTASLPPTPASAPGGAAAAQRCPAPRQRDRHRLGLDQQHRVSVSALCKHVRSARMDFSAILRIRRTDREPAQRRSWQGFLGARRSAGAWRVRQPWRWPALSAPQAYAVQRGARRPPRPSRSSRSSCGAACRTTTPGIPSPSRAATTWATSWTRSRPTSSGIRLGGLFPLLAKQADKFSLIRSMTHRNNGHETAAYLMQTGHAPGERISYPSVGAVFALAKSQTYKGLIPPYVVLTSPQGRFSEEGFLGPKYKPFATGGDPNNDTLRGRRHRGPGHYRRTSAGPPQPVATSWTPWARSWRRPTRRSPPPRKPRTPPTS